MLLSLSPVYFVQTLELQNLSVQSYRRLGLDSPGLVVLSWREEHVALAHACKMYLTVLLVTAEFLWVNKISVSRAIHMAPFTSTNST